MYKYIFIFKNYYFTFRKKCYLYKCTKSLSMKRVNTNRKYSLPNIPPVGFANFFITICLKDALQKSVADQLQAEFEQNKAQILRDHPNDHEELLYQEKIRFFAKYDHTLDYHPRGLRLLKQPYVQRAVKDELREMDGKHFTLIAYCVMPNHIHLLIDIFHQLEDKNMNQSDHDQHCTQLNTTLEKIKGRTAYYSNQVLRRRGNFWHDYNYIHHVRDDAEWCNIVNYIMLNPVRAGLARTSAEYDHCYYKYDY